MHLNQVSSCCGSSVEEGSMKEFPLGVRTWYINYKVDICTKCKQECDVTEECGICGEIGCKNECEGDEGIA